MPSEPDRQFDAIVQARHGDPFSVLGMHLADGHLVVRTFQPQASAVEVVERKSGKAVAALDRVHPDGLFEARLARKLYELAMSHADMPGDNTARFTRKFSQSELAAMLGATREAIKR